jgi:hypothetical protein
VRKFHEVHQNISCHEPEIACSLSLINEEKSIKKLLTANQFITEEL